MAYFKHYVSILSYSYWQLWLRKKLYSSVCRNELILSLIRKFCSSLIHSIILCIFRNCQWRIAHKFSATGLYKKKKIVFTASIWHYLRVLQLKRDSLLPRKKRRANIDADEVYCLIPALWIATCWFIKIENMEHDKDRTQQHQFNGESPLQEHMVLRIMGKLGTHFVYTTIYYQSTLPRDPN